jgi:hypothetical protein
MSSTTKSQSSNGSDPFKYEVYQAKKIVNTVSHILATVVGENYYQKVPKNLIESQKKMPFFSTNPTSVSISDFLYRILKYTHIEESTLVLALIYIDKVCESKDVILNKFNIHR